MKTIHKHDLQTIHYTGGHIRTFGEVILEEKSVKVINDSDDFTVEFNDHQMRFTLTFEHKISRAVFSLTPFYEYVGDNPYLSIHAARQGTHELGVALSDGGSPFAKPGCGFWLMVTYLGCCAY